jgi:dTMP kinase
VFIVLEGPEGGGKSTQATRLQARLRQLSRDAIVTREPGGTPTGAAIRALLLGQAHAIDPTTEFLLYAADRAQHVHEVILPALGAGRCVISDRFAGASLAYQGYGRGLDLAWLTDVNHRATHGVTPDVTLLLDVPPEVGLARAASRGALDRLEAAEGAFHQRVRRGFQALAAERGWIVIDATQPADAVASEIWAAVAPLAAERA